MSRFTENLVVSPFPDGKTWIVLSDFRYEVGTLGSGDVINVKIGFMTDFASVPRFLWVILPRWGRYGYAAVIHDWLYWEQSRSREAADRILFEAMSVPVFRVPTWQKYLIYWAVWAFGSIAWRRHRRMRAPGSS